MYESKNAKRKKEALEWIKSLVIVVVVVFLLRMFVFGTVLVKGISMEPTLSHGNFVFINKLVYNIGSPKTGDIIVCSYEKGAGEENLVKRIIGVPGDVIDFQMNEHYEYVVYINDLPLDEPYIKESIDQIGDMDYPYTIPEGYYFVMGDNRNSSNDSRSKLIGPIAKDKIDGKVQIRIYPFNEISVF